MTGKKTLYKQSFIAISLLALSASLGNHALAATTAKVSQDVVMADVAKNSVSQGQGGTLNIPEITNQYNPALANLVRLGVRPYYLGNRSGVDGWLLLKEQQVQFAYVPQGGKDVIIGAMFDGGGQNITAQQLSELTRVNPGIVSALSAGLMKQPQSGLGPQGVGSPQGAGQGGTVSVGEKLIQDFSPAASVNLGSATAPMVSMIMDPNCPHCQATWKVLRDAVLNNMLQVRLIPIGTADSDSERAAAVLTHISNPLNAWDKYVSGDKSQLVGVPDPSQISAIRANRLLVDNWHIDATPYFFYRGKSGQVKIIKGELHDSKTIVSDVGP